MYTIGTTAGHPTYQSLNGFTLNCCSHASPNKAVKVDKELNSWEILTIQNEPESEPSKAPSINTTNEPNTHGYIQWRKFYEHWPVPVVARNKNFEVWHYGAERNLNQVLPYTEGKQAECSGPHLQALQSAQKALDSFSANLGHEFILADQPMPIVVGHPKLSSHQPFYQQSPFKCIGVSDQSEYIHPDSISHETGHAILDRCHQYNYQDFETAAAHEAFADCCSLLSAWQEPEILWDVLRQRALGSNSNKLTAIGESLGPHRSAYPIRDLAQDQWQLTANSSQLPNPHTYSQRFTQAFYRCLLAWEQLYKCTNLSTLNPVPVLSPTLQNELQNSNLPISSLDCLAITAASQTLGRHFANSLYFLPSTSNLKLTDLSKAIIEAGRSLEKDPQVSDNIYKANLPL
ncbi:MAG: hypothetical protein ACI38Q_06410 [Candidatus Bruticola sp.]